MNNAIIYYDIAALVVLIICGTYFVRTSSFKSARFSMVSHALILGLIGGTADIIRILIYDPASTDKSMFLIASAIYNICISAAVLSYIILMISITDTWHLVKKRRFSVVASVIPFVLLVILAIYGMMSEAIYIFLEDGLIEYNWGYYVIGLGIYLYIYIAFLYIKDIKKLIATSYKSAFVYPLLVMIVAVTVQAFYSTHHVIIFAIASDCLMLLVVGQRVEEAHDITTGMHTYWMFAKDMGLKIGTGKELKLILANIINYEHALRLAGYDEMLEMMKPLSSEIMRVLKSYKVKFTCYYDGEGKFAIELPKVSDELIEDIANNIARAINNNIRLEVFDFELKINTCIVNCPKDISDVEGLFMLSTDLDMFPSDGKVVSASDITGTKEFQIKKDMTTILDRAINNHYFSVFYQPIYNVKEKRFTSAEALIRLRDPKYGYISPSLFIPLAEKSGAIHKIGSFVIDKVCQFIASDDFSKLNLDYIEINLSVMQCLRMDLADEILAVAKKYNIDPKKLNLEITETASAYSQEKMLLNIEKLSEAGFPFSLDDFGTGYSNLMRITSLPLSIVKLDRTFVLLLEEKSGFYVIIKNLISMLKDMGFDILVEGIESKEMVDMFTELGVDEIQGFYFSRPLTRTDYVAFLKKQM